MSTATGQAIAPWEANPSALVSLWDMIEYLGKSFLRLHLRVNEAQSYLEEEAKGKKYERQISELDLKRFFKLMQDAKTEFERYGITMGLDRVRRISYNLENGINYGAMAHELETMWEYVEEHMDRARFAYVIPSKAEYFEAEKLFGTQVIKRFPSAKQDIMDAGHCYALELNTACILHLVRVAERGLKALAKERGWGAPKTPLGYQEWGRLLNHVEDEAKKITAGWPRGPERETVSDFYDSCVSSLRHFKATRDRTVHSRSDNYSDELTVKAMGHVIDFMKTVSTKVSEHSRKPIRWKRP